jgi:hypothetical protein
MYKIVRNCQMSVSAGQCSTEDAKALRYTIKTWSSKMSSQVSNSSRFRFNLASQETDTAFSFAMMKVVIMEISSHHSMQSSSVHDTQRLDEYMDDEDGIFALDGLGISSIRTMIAPSLQSGAIIVRMEAHTPGQIQQAPSIEGNGV